MRKLHFSWDVQQGTYLFEELSFYYTAITIYTIVLAKVQDIYYFVSFHL